MTDIKHEKMATDTLFCVVSFAERIDKGKHLFTRLLLLHIVCATGSLTSGRVHTHYEKCDEKSDFLRFMFPPQ